MSVDLFKEQIISMVHLVRNL